MGIEHEYPRRLPIVTIDGKKYYSDSRLRQLRNVENPHDFMDFSASEWVTLHTFLDPELLRKVRTKKGEERL